MNPNEKLNWQNKLQKGTKVMNRQWFLHLDGDSTFTLESKTDVYTGPCLLFCLPGGISNCTEISSYFSSAKISWFSWKSTVVTFHSFKPLWKIRTEMTRHPFKVGCFYGCSYQLTKPLLSYYSGPNQPKAFPLLRNMAHTFEFGAHFAHIWNCRATLHALLKSMRTWRALMKLVCTWHTLL